MTSSPISGLIHPFQFEDFFQRGIAPLCVMGKGKRHRDIRIKAADGGREIEIGPVALEPVVTAIELVMKAPGGGNAYAGIGQNKVVDLGPT